jgi:hypothetical protein
MFGGQLFLAGIAGDDESYSVGELVVEAGTSNLDPPRNTPIIPR